MAVSRTIVLRGIAVHNLKSIDLDLPHRSLIVLCGVSGSGKSSLAFDTLYAEGQRRYIESFSTYTRQFLERLEKPAAEQIDGIPPAIAVAHSQPSRSSRTTIGTITETNDYLRLLFSKIGHIFCPRCGTEIRRETSQTVAELVGKLPDPSRFLIAYPTEWRVDTPAERLASSLCEMGFVRVILGDRMLRLDDPSGVAALSRVDPESAEPFTLGAESDNAALPTPTHLDVVVDRLTAGGTSKERLRDSLETAFVRGEGACSLYILATEPAENVEDRNSGQSLSESWAQRSRWTRNHGIAARLAIVCNATAAASSIRSPSRGCTASIVRSELVRRAKDSAALSTWISIWWCRTNASRCARVRSPLGTPRLTPTSSGNFWRWPTITSCPSIYRSSSSRKSSYGSSAMACRNANSVGCRDSLPGSSGESTRYTSAYFSAVGEAIAPVPSVAEAGLRPWRWPPALAARTSPKSRRMRIRDLIAFLDRLDLPAWERQIGRAMLAQVGSRLRYLDEAGIGYLSLDRTLRTLSSGEAQRVALTSTLGSSLVNMLYVLDEPSIGLHPRDTERLVTAIRGLRDRGNTVVVVEHEEAVIRAADQVVEIGPGAGERGGKVVFQGTPDEMLVAPQSLTGDYLSGRRPMRSPARRRPTSHGWVRLVARGETISRTSRSHFPWAFCALSPV